jgi:hypothetical protein
VRCTLNVVQGIGDTFWVYQKVAPHVDCVDFNIMYVGDKDLNGGIQQRALAFLRLLPKVGEVKLLSVSSERYAKTAETRFSLRDVLLRATATGLAVDYACNRPLEEGVKIADIDPELCLQEVVPLCEEALPLPPRPYSVLYVSHATGLPGFWDPAQWATLVCYLHGWGAADFRRCMVIGAPYDLAPSKAVAELLRAEGYDVTLHIGLPWPKVHYLLRRADFFLGHQSGLNVIADQLRTRQLMLYVAKLAPMMYTWCRPEHARGVFRADLLSSKPEEVAARYVGEK